MDKLVPVPEAEAIIVANYCDQIIREIKDKLDQLHKDFPLVEISGHTDITAVGFTRGWRLADCIFDKRGIDTIFACKQGLTKSASYVASIVEIAGKISRDTIP